VSKLTKYSPSEARPLSITARWLPCQTPVARSACAADAPSIFDSTVADRLFTVWMTPTVAIEMGAGRMQFTKVPSGAIIRMGREIPSFQVTSQHSSG